MAVLVDGTKFLENRNRLIHSRNLWWIDSAAQKLLGKTRMRISAVATSSRSLTLTSSWSRVAFTVRQMLSSGTRKISGRGNCAILRSRARVYSL